MIIQTNFINSTVDVTSCEIKKKKIRFDFIFPEETLWVRILMTGIKLSKKQKISQQFLSLCLKFSPLWKYWPSLVTFFLQHMKLKLPL